MRDFARLLLNSTSDVCFFPKKYLDAEFSRKKLFLQANCKDKLLWCKIFTHTNSIFWLQGRKHSLPFKIKGLSLTRFHYYIFLWIQWYFLWPLSNCCWGSLDGICISCEVPSIADTTLGISEQYHFFCHHTGMVGHWILRLHTFYKSTHVDFKTLSTVETLTPTHD